VIEPEKKDLPYYQNLCEEDGCLSRATRIIKSLTTYSWVCEQCYGKYKI
jgi:hypothetical protein